MSRRTAIGLGLVALLLVVRHVDVSLVRATIGRALARQLPLLAVLPAWLVGNRWLPWNDLGRLETARAGDVGELDAAEVEWRKALALAPDDPLPLANLGDLLVERRRFGEARALLQRALRGDPSDSRARLSLALAAAGLGDAEAAERQVDSVLAREAPGEVTDLAARIRSELRARRARRAAPGRP